MKRILISFLAAAAFLAVPAFAQDDPRIATGEAAAETWLALTDLGYYAAAWDQSAASFQASVPKPSWLTGITKLREPLGRPISRTASSARFAEWLIGAPNGEYVTIEYESAFEAKPDVVEIVTTQHQKDGSWKVMGYQLK
jgi:hypothetical protein